MIFIIVWNPSAFYLINVLLKGFKLNASEDRTQILGPLSEWHRSQVRRTNPNRPFIPKTGVLTMQWREQVVIKRVPHPPCFPDLAPSSFYLFGHTKQLLLGYEFADRDSLLRAVSGILKLIKKATLAGIFRG
jgi:hypothetical protein